MKAGRRRATIVLLLAGGAALTAAAWRPHQYAADGKPKLDLEKLFPRQFGDWTMDETGPPQLVSPDQEALIQRLYSQTLERVYFNRAGSYVMLSVAYGGDQSDATRAHRPEVCYPAAGFTISQPATQTLTLPSHQLTVRQLVATSGRRIEPITYWIMVGTRPTATGTEQKLAQLSYTMRGVIPEGMLVRVSTLDRSAESAFRVHVSFVTALHAAMGRESAESVFGDSD